MYQYKDYLPEILRDSREYRAIGAAVDEQAAILADRQPELLRARRIGSAPEGIIDRWEQVLGLGYNPDMSLDERRYRVLVQVRLRMVMTLRKLKEELDRITDTVPSKSLIWPTAPMQGTPKNPSEATGDWMRPTAEGAAVSVDYDRYLLRVQVSLKSRHNFDTVDRLLRETMPANLVLIIQQLYNRWGYLDGSVWRTLRRCTWRQLRTGLYGPWGRYGQASWGRAAAKSWRQMREDVT